MTVCQLYEKHTSQKRNVKRGTTVGRKQFLDILKADKLGTRAIDTVKLSDGKEWVIRMKDNGYAYKTISNYKRSLKAMFYTAIQDDCVRKNPFDFNIGDILEDDTKPKEILTSEQEESLLLFAENDKTYQKNCDEIIILLGTGLRISELCGLTVTDLDFKKSTNQCRPSAIEKYRDRLLHRSSKNKKRCQTATYDRGSLPSIPTSIEE